MKRGIFLVLGLMVCLMVPVATEADSVYVGDYCWETSNGDTVIFSAFFLGYDSNGHEIINYIGRWDGFPVNGNCIDTFSGMERVYECNYLVTGDFGNSLVFAILDYLSLDGEGNGVLNQISGSSVNSFLIAPFGFTLIACPTW